MTRKYDCGRIQVLVDYFPTRLRRWCVRVMDPVHYTPEDADFERRTFRFTQHGAHIAAARIANQINEDIELEWPKT